MPSPSRPKLRLRTTRWQETCNARGLITDQSRAVAIGVHRSQIIRVQNGQSSPGEAFMAAACATFDLHLDDLFEVVRP